MIAIRLKMTIDDEEYIPLATKLLTKPRIKKMYVIRSPDGIITKEKVSSKNKKKITDLRKMGYVVTTEDKVQNRGLNELMGIPVKITPMRNGGYANGVRIHVDIEGDSKAEINKNSEKVVATISKYLNKSGVPLNRICRESVTGCLTQS